MRINDVFFAGHASCIALATLAQCAVYERGAQRVHEHTRLAFAVVVPLTLTFGAAAWLFPHDISVISCAPLPVMQTVAMVPLTLLTSGAAVQLFPPHIVVILCARLPVMLTVIMVLLMLMSCAAARLYRDSVFVTSSSALPVMQTVAMAQLTPTSPAAALSVPHQRICHRVIHPACRRAETPGTVLLLSLVV